MRMDFKQIVDSRMYIKARTMNRYSIYSVEFKWYALAMTILFEENYGNNYDNYWYKKGTTR